MSFRAKVLVPMIAVMVALLAVTVWVVNDHITDQLKTEAQITLNTAARVFRARQEGRRKDLLLRFRILANVPLYKSAFQTLHPQTVREKLKDVLHESGVRETGVEIVMFTGPPDNKDVAALEPMFQNGDPSISMTVFQAASGIRFASARSFMTWFRSL